jgi:hypothetical protein
MPPGLIGSEASHCKERLTLAASRVVNAVSAPSFFACARRRKLRVTFIKSGQCLNARHFLIKANGRARKRPPAYPAAAAPAIAIVPPPRSFAPVSFALS